MITADRAIPLLLEACPSFAPAWRAHTSEPSYEPGLTHIDLSCFARHVTKLLAAGQTAELVSVFSCVERLLVEGNDYLQNAIVVSFLEDLQGDLLRANLTLQSCATFLGPQTHQFWDALIRDWGRPGHIDRPRSGGAA
jgi:hypothetical protein